MSTEEIIIKRLAELEKKMVEEGDYDVYKKLESDHKDLKSFYDALKRHLGEN